MNRLLVKIWKFIYLFIILLPIALLSLFFGNDTTCFVEYWLEKFDEYKDYKV